MTFKQLDEVLPFFGMDFEGIVEQVNKEINKQAEEIRANTNTYKGIYAMHKYWGKKPFNKATDYEQHIRFLIKITWILALPVSTIKKNWLLLFIGIGECLR